MLEILAFYVLGRKIGRIAADKGRDGNVFTALFVGVWLLGEVGGLLFGLALTGSHTPFLVHYAIGLLGAGGGAFLVYTIVVSLPDTPFGEGKRNRDDRPRRVKAGAGRKRPRRPAEVVDRGAARQRSRLEASEVYAIQDGAPRSRRKKSRPYQASW